MGRATATILLASRCRDGNARTRRPFDTVYCDLRDSERAGSRPTISVGFPIVLQTVRFSIQMWLILCRDLSSAICFTYFVPEL